MIEIGDREVGSTIRFSFSTFFPAGSLNDQFENLANTGDPAFAVRRLSDNTTLTTGLTVGVNAIAAGRHSFTLDTALDPNFYHLDNTYELIVTDGEVHDGTAWVNVTNEVVLSFNLQSTSSGKVLERAVKVAHGAVILAAPRTTKKFVLQIVNAGQSQNYYQWQILEWQPGAVNQGIGRVILKSQTSGDQVTMTVMNDLPQIPSVGDVAAIIPEEQPRRIGVALITAEFTPTDKYWAEWSTDGDMKAPTAAPIINVWNVVTNSLVIANGTMTQVAQNAWSYTHSTQDIHPHQAARIVISATIDEIAYNWSRIYPHTVQ